VKKIKIRRTKDGRLILNKGTPLMSAHIFRDVERPSLLQHQVEWYDYDGCGYAIVEEATIKQALQRFLEKAVVEVFVKVKGKIKTVFVPFNPRPGDTFAVIEMLGNESHRPRDKVMPPAFLDGGTGKYAGFDPRKIIALRNGLLYLPTRKLLPHTSQFFTLNVIPVTYDAKAPLPRQWLEFLSQAMRKRTPLIELLQEMMGYGLDADTSLQKIFFLWGLPAAGKGTIMRILERLAGEGNCSHPSILDLNGTFGLEHCINKSNIMITDMNVKKELSNAADVLKAVSGEDSRNCNRKNKQSWHGKLSGRLWIGGNRLPNFGEDATALYRRLLVLPFEESFEGREDFELTTKLMTELPGILSWCLDGLDRLRKRGRFVDLPESREAKRRMLFLSEPVRGLIELRCVVDARARVDIDVLYGEYVIYCEEGRLHPLAKNKFSESLMSSFPAIRHGRRSKADGKFVQVYTGVRLNAERAAAAYRHDPDLVKMLGDIDPAKPKAPPAANSLTILCDADGAPVPKGSNDFGHESVESL
jgi:putative DNA primase/helicase